MDPHLRALRYFAAVAEEQSVTRAAERLFVSQPALSKQVRQLERLLRAELLHREPRGVRLTAAGEALLPRARAVLAEWERAVDDVGAADQTLTVGFHTRIGRGLVPGVTARLAAELPGWRLRFQQVSWADPAVGLAAGGVDVAVAWLPVPPGAALASKVVATEERLVALPAGHRLAGRERLRLADLADEPFVALPGSAGPMRDFWLAAAQRSTPALVGAEAATAEECYEAVSAGVGVALVAAGNAALYQRDEVVHRPVDDLPPAELAVLWRRADRRPVVRVAVDACCVCAVADR
jgi:DNA-binding transcriptional LysR family regulator